MKLREVLMVVALGLNLTKTETRVLELAMVSTITLRYGLIPTSVGGVLLSLISGITISILEVSLIVKGGR